MDDSEFQIVAASNADLAEVQVFLEPFMDGERLLKRTSLELELLLKHAFKAVVSERMIGFCALEIYSKKLAELQCLAVDPEFRRKGVGRALVLQCVQVARDEKVKEMMAISASDVMFKSCGFDYSLPNQKRALFIEP